MTEVLSPPVLEELRTQLEAKRACHETEIRATRAAQGRDASPSTDQSSVPAGDAGDASVELEARETTDRLLLDLTMHFIEVEHALAKLERGSYGLRERCGRPIPLARLRAVPEARYDVEHQAEVDARATDR